jgi:hypothetical protein
MYFLQIHQFSILEQFLIFKACNSEKNVAKDIDVAQPIWLSGCSEKGHFIAKNVFNVLALK